MTTSSLHYNEFITAIIDGKDVYTIKDNGGIPAPFGDGGKRSMPFWSTENRAKLIIKNVMAFRGMKVMRITNDDFINKWLPGTSKDGLNIGCNWSGTSATGYDCNPLDILKTLKLRKPAQQGDAPEPATIADPASPSSLSPAR